MLLFSITHLWNLRKWNRFKNCILIKISKKINQIRLRLKYHDLFLSRLKVLPNLIL